MRMFAVIAVLAVLSIVTVSEGADWLHLIEDGNGSNYYIDMDSINYTSDNTVRLIKKVEAVNSPARTVRVELDCREARIRPLGETLGDSADRGDEQWRPAGSDDIDELLLELVCSLKKPAD